jgi:hypothetical protein
MALDKDLLGVGMPDAQARRVGLTANAAVIAAGTTTTDATVLKKEQKVVTMTATGSDGIRMPSDAELNTPYYIYNSSGSTGKVYPTSGATLNGGAADAALSMTTLKVAILMRLSTNVWIYNLTA